MNFLCHIYADVVRSQSYDPHGRSVISKQRGLLLIPYSLLLTVYCLLSTQVYGQKSTEGPPIIMPYGSGAQYYVYLGEDKGLQINAQVWGEVLRPGMYSVPKTTDVIGLISFAGGPTKDADLGKVKLIRGNPEEVISIDLKRYMKTGDVSRIPVLKPGDTVIISQNLSYKLARVVTVISQLAIVANVYYLFFVRE